MDFLLNTELYYNKHGYYEGNIYNSAHYDILLC